MDHPSTAATSAARSARASRPAPWTPWLFLAPFLTLFLLFLMLPAIAAVAISFTEWQIVGAPVFNGMQNYRTILMDPAFLVATKNTAYFVAISVPVLIALPLALAMLLNTKRRGVRFVRTLVYLPTVIMVTTVATLWLWLMDSRFGLLNYYLSLIGLGPVKWLISERWAMISILIATVWWTVGRNMVIYLAGLQEIPEDLYEAAEIDGAGRWRRWLHVTWPMLSNVNGFVIPFTFVTGWQVFGQVFLLTNGGPGQSTIVLTQYIYLTAFSDFDMGPAAAASVIMLIIMLLSTLVVLKTLKVKV